MTVSNDREIALRDLVARHAGSRGALLPLLHHIQRELGCVPAAAVPIVADGLNLSRAEVHGVISFYHDFRDAPAAARAVRLCRAEACQSRGADASAAALDLAGVAHEPVYCLGLCAVGPAALVDGVPVAGVNGMGDLEGPGARRSLEPRAVPPVPLGDRVRLGRAFISCDTASVALGADAVADALAAAGCDVVRTGSRGLFAIEPLVEIETQGGGWATARLRRTMFRACSMARTPIASATSRRCRSSRGSSASPSPGAA